MKAILNLIKDDADNVIDCLRMSDMAYWEAIKTEAIYPFIAANKPYGKRIIDKNVDRDDVYSHIYEKMVINRGYKI